MDCGGFREDLTTIAEGGAAPEAAAHARTCTACAAWLATERRIVNAARLAQREPPTDVLARAYALMPARPRLLARLIGSNLAASGMRRSATDRFSLHLQAGEEPLHLQYIPTENGWEILGRAPSPDGSVARGGEAIDCGPAGRFRLIVPSLDDSGFTLRAGGVEIDVPPAGEMLGRDA